MSDEIPPQLKDKRGRELRGAARAAAEAKLRDGKGPRPPRAGARSPAPAVSTGTSLVDRLRRIW